MINKVILQGRLTKDIEVRNTSNQKPVTQFSLAVERNIKNSEGKYDADFINCVAWNQTATFLGSYFHKGDMMCIVGKIQTRSYNDNSGNKVFVTEVIVDEVSFCGGSQKAQNAQQKPQEKPSVYDEAEDEEGLPFDV